MKRYLHSKEILIGLLLILGFSVVLQQNLQAGSGSCDQFMAPKHNVNGKMVGQEECLMEDHDLVDPERKYHRVDIGLTGTLSGWMTKEGARSSYFTSAPEYVFTQEGNNHPLFHGILRYEAAKGTSLTLYYPQNGWNGKMYFMLYGGSGSFLQGSLTPFLGPHDGARPILEYPGHQYFDAAHPFEPMRFERLMLEKGYAVIRCWRNAATDVPGDYDVVLDDGTIWPGMNVAFFPELMLDEVRLMKNFLQDRLGRRPTRTYWYGHSGGSMEQSLFSYMHSLNPQLNTDTDGKDTIDGLLWGDVGAGLFLPFLRKNGQDVLFRTAEEKARFVKSIELSHLEDHRYFTSENTWRMDIKNLPEGVSPVFKVNTRNRARMMHDKGMDSVYRYYEVRGINHDADDAISNDGKQSDMVILQESRLVDALIDRLDEWVERGIAPPPSKADIDIGFGNQKSAIDMPETACPLGVYHDSPASKGSSGSGTTGLALFQGKGVEPVDGRSMFVDMNGNGIRDQQETMTQAWRRLGLLRGDETFSRDKYVACVQRAVDTLRKENLLTEKGAQLYLKEAKTQEFPSS